MTTILIYTFRNIYFYTIALSLAVVFNVPFLTKARLPVIFTTFLRKRITKVPQHFLHYIPRSWDCN